MPAVLDGGKLEGDGTPVTHTAFAALMQPLGDFKKGETVAVAVSGGPDSMALTCLAGEWAASNGLTLIGLTVDHRLRAQAKEEARQVHDWLTKRGVGHHTLVWDEGHSISQLDRSPQAAARDARFELMCRWCREHDVKTLLVAHHADDQVETFMQRLLRGSGVDGLAAMAAVTPRQDIKVVRPLLSVAKADLMATCRHHQQSWFDDPSNDDENYTRVRMRKLLAALEEEGLNTDRLLDTVGHLQRAKAAIDDAVAKILTQARTPTEDGTFKLDLSVILAAPEEVGLRCLARCLCQVSGAAYPPRFERLLRLYTALGSADWSDRTLHGCEIRVSGGMVRLLPESKERQNSG